MTAELCCPPLTYRMALLERPEPKPHEAFFSKLARPARGAFRLLNAMGRQLSGQSADALRLAEFVAREHSIGRF